MLVLLPMLYLCATVCADTVDVTTSSGTVRGQTIKEFDKTIDQFLSIPFAEPPVGPLRFQKPKPITKPVTGIIDATKKRTSCHGGDAPSSEDCLFVNIWAPHNKTTLKPVMFWIYGGGFRGGSIFSEMYNGKSIAALGDVVYVAVDYRLGTLGFLYGGTDQEPGNLGFFDMIEGLKWVRQNIHLFGGDKDVITIFGESAGAFASSALVLSPLAKGLFKRAILESGAHYPNRLDTYSKTQALNEAKEMANHFKCIDEKTWLQCLKNVSADQLHGYTDVSVGALVGTDFLPIPPQDAFAQNKYNQDVDLIAGVVRNEGSLLAPGDSKGTLSVDKWKQLAKEVQKNFPHIDLDKTEQHYLANVNRSDSQALRWAFYDLFGDLLINCPAYLFARQVAKHSNGKNVYFYEQTYQSGGHLQGCDEKTMGICHGSDLEFVFYRTGGSGQIDLVFSKEWISYWTNFAKTGVPTTEQKWPKFVDQSSRIKELNAHDLTKTMTNPFGDKCDVFWKSYFE